VSKPNNRMVLIGMHLYFLPALLFQVCALWKIYRDYSWGHQNFWVLPAIFALVVLLISTALSFMILVKTTANYFKWKNES